MTIPILVDADDGDGWGMSHVELVILDADTQQELGVFTSDGEPHAWEPGFPQGSFLIKAIAHDLAGHTAETPTRPISIGVVPPGSDDDGDGDDGASSEGGGDGSSEGGDGSSVGDGDADGGDRGGSDGTGGGDDGSSASDSSDAGCGCRNASDRNGHWSWLGLMVFLARRRTRLAVVRPRRPSAKAS